LASGLRARREERDTEKMRGRKRDGFTALNALLHSRKGVNVIGFFPEEKGIKDGNCV